MRWILIVSALSNLAALGWVARLQGRLDQTDRKVAMQDPINEAILKKIRQFDRAAIVLHSHLQGGAK